MNEILEEVLDKRIVESFDKLLDDLRLSWQNSESILGGIPDAISEVMYVIILSKYYDFPKLNFWIP